MSEYAFDGDSKASGPRLDLGPEPQSPRAPERHMRFNAGESLDEREVHLLDYVKVLYKRRWTAITTFLLVLISVTVFTFTATPIYQAKTRLLIETENQNVVSFKAVVDE